MKKFNYIENKMFVIYAKKNLVLMRFMKKIYKVWDHFQYTGKYRGAAHNVFNLKYKWLKEIVFHLDSKYDYHFIIKKLEEEFKGQFECLGQNTEKYIAFPVLIKTELENDKTIIYEMKFVDSFRFMSSSSSSLVDNLSEGLHNDKCIDYISTKR